MAGQLLAEHRDRDSKYVCRRLPDPSHLRITQDGQLVGDPRLQRIQQHLSFCQWRARRWLIEYVADHHRQLHSSLITFRVKVGSCKPDSGRGGLTQRTLLTTTEHPVSQTLAACICEQSDQPCSQSISDKYHTYSLAGLEPIRRFPELCTASANSLRQGN